MDYAIVKDTSPQSEYDKLEYHYGYNIPYQHDPSYVLSVGRNTSIARWFTEHSHKAHGVPLGRLVRLPYWVRVTLRGHVQLR